MVTVLFVLTWTLWYIPAVPLPDNRAGDSDGKDNHQWPAQTSQCPALTLCPLAVVSMDLSEEDLRITSDEEPPGDDLPGRAGHGLDHGNEPLFK